MGERSSQPVIRGDVRGRPRSRAPLVGRSGEISMLNNQLTCMLDGNGRVVLVSGDAGIGKTALVNELAPAAEALGCLVLWGHAYDRSVTPPYGPWLEMLRSVPANDESRAAVATLLPDEHVLGAAGSQDALFRMLVAVFQDHALRQPLMLVLEDVHWMDQGSLDYLRFLARRIDSHRILLLATYRSDELHPQHPLYVLLPLVIREADAERLAVRRLDAAGQRALISSRYSISEHDAVRLTHYLQTHAEGNPLFALELLRSLEEERVLRQRDGAWVLGDTTAVRIPLLLRQIIEHRLGRLGNETRALLQVAAIIGQEVPLDVWGQVTGAGDEALADAIEQGLAAQLLQESAGGVGIRFQHALLRDALYESIVALRRRGWHRATAEALAARHKPVPDTVAHHFQQAGDVRAVAWLLESARRARMSFATATALDRLETAMDLDNRLDGASGLRGWLLAARAGWGEIFAHTDERMRMLDEAMAIALRMSDDALTEFVEWSQALIDTNFSAPVGEMLGAVRDRIQNLPPGERERLFGFIYGAAGAALDPSGPEVTCLVIGFHAQSGQYHEALAAVERIRTEHPSLSAAAEQHLDTARMACAQALGRPDDALQCYERVLAAHRRDHVSDWAAVMAWLKLRDLVLVYWPDRISMRDAVANEALAAVRQAKAEQTFGQDMPDEVGVAWLLLVDGRWADARRVLEPVADHWASLLTVAPWMVLSRHQGAPDAALARLPLVFSDGPASKPGRTTFETSVDCMHAAIEIALDAGDGALASAWLECHDRWMAWSGHIPFATIGHRLWARYYRVSDDRAVAQERAKQALVLATEPRQPLTLLAVHRLLGELDTECGDYDRAHQHLTEAVALADACQAPFERALTLVAAAELAVARGEPNTARPLLAEARTICEPLCAQPTLERVSALEARLAVTAKPRYPAGLSAREVEVLRLVAQGLTDAQVAERLFLSPRTVSQHLRSVYNKLGVNSRTAATRFAIEQRLG